MDISELLNSQHGQEIIDGISRQTGTTPQETASVVTTSAPLLLGMLRKNASTEQGAQGILGALQEHDGSILDNLSGFLSQGNTADGNGILSHILGGNRDTMEHAISKQTGVSSGSVSKIIAMLAPVIMGYLGKQKRQTGDADNSTGLGGLLGNLMGGSGSSITALLDQDGDGKLSINDAVAALSGKKSGGLGGMLGGLFGKE